MLNASAPVSVQQLSNKRLWTGMDGMQIFRLDNMCGPCGLTALGATLRLALAEMILIKLLEAAPFMWNCERCGERGLLWTTDRACRRICAGQAVCEPISDARPRRNSNAVHLWRFSYRQTTWLLTRGGS